MRVALAAFEDFTAGMTAFVAARFFPPEIPLDRTSGGAFFAFNGVSGVFANAISFGRVSGHDKGLLVRYEETTDAGPNGFMNEFEGATADANAHVFEVSASGGTPGAPAGGVVAVDGVIVQMSRSNAVVPARVPRTDNYVGAAPLRVDPDRLFIGDMGEVIVFARQMQAAERDRIRAYLKARWRTP